MKPFDMLEIEEKSREEEKRNKKFESYFALSLAIILLVVAISMMIYVCIG